jgi:hypothetical protein
MPQVADSSTPPSGAAFEVRFSKQHWGLRSRPLHPRLSGRFRLRSLAPSNQLIQVIPVRPIGAEALFIEQALGATAQTDLVRVTLHPHWPAHLAMPAPAERHYCHSRQASRHHPNRPEPPVSLRFFASSRTFRNHSSRRCHNSQHRTDCSAGQTQNGRTGRFSFSSPLSSLFVPPNAPLGPVPTDIAVQTGRTLPLKNRALAFVGYGTKKRPCAEVKPGRPTNAMKSSWT